MVQSLSGLSVISGVMFAVMLFSNVAYSEISVDQKGSSIHLSGEITINSANEFISVVAAYPKANILSLDSNGGSVAAALAIATVARSSQMSTVVSEDATCASACSIIFFSGLSRHAYGALGVHQIYSTDPSATVEGLKNAYELTFDALIDYNTPFFVLEKMIETPPHEMYFFEDWEKEQKLINALYYDLKPRPPGLTKVRFGEYKVEVEKFNGVQLPDFKGRDRSARMFRTRISEAIKQGPNFASKYAMIQIGCGTDCSFVYVADTQTGEVKDFPHGGELKFKLQLLYSKDSRLVKARWLDIDTYTCIQDDLVWDGQQFASVFQYNYPSDDGYC